MLERRERRFGVLKLSAELVDSGQCTNMFLDLQITTDHTEFDHQSQCICLGIISPQLPPVEEGAVAPTVNVILNQETGKYEFVL